MDSFLVSARKYRPQTFETVVGQSHITGTLKNAIIHTQLAQAYLFCGPRGVGKTTCARIFAKTINCESHINGEACNQCTSCIAFNEASSLNIYELDAASNNSVDDIRQLVDQVRFAPQMGSFKVYIIDEVHMLSTAAFNAFLKTLEEPPAHAKFILATTEKHKIIPTILSRCQVYTFNRIKQEDISNHLAFLANSENVTFEAEALSVIAEKAEGGLRDACSIFDQMVASTDGHLNYKAVIEHLHVLDASIYFKLSESLIQGTRDTGLIILNTILNQGFDPHQFIIGLGQHFRNILLCKFPAAAELLETSSAFKNLYKQQAHLFSEVLLVKLITLVQKVDGQYKTSKNQRLLIEWVLLQMSYLTVPETDEKKKPLTDNTEYLHSGKTEDTPQNRIKTEILQPDATVHKTQVISEIKQNYVTETPVTTTPTSSAALKNHSENVKPATHHLKIKSGFSIHAAQHKTHKTSETQAEDTELADLPLTIDRIQQFLNKQAELLQTKGQFQKSIMFKNAGVACEHSVCTLTLMNETQLEQFNTIKQDLLDQMRIALQHKPLQLLAKISKQLESPKAFRPTDILNEMSKKNPAILNLKQHFDLDIDY